MRISQALWRADRGWEGGLEADPTAGLVLSLASPGLLEEPIRAAELREAFPNAALIGCSTGGEIHGDDAYEGTISVTAVSFARTEVVPAVVDLAAHADVEAAGRALGQALRRPGLKAALVFSDGTQVNGSLLIQGMRAILGDAVFISGGLAGDGDRFGRTTVMFEGAAVPGRIAAAGLVGEAVRVTHGSAGGWDAFGPERVITRARGNVLYELDGQPALTLYKRYLGEEAARLPSSALFFPLHIYRAGAEEDALVRTVVGIDEASEAMIFAGDIPEDWHARLMRGNLDRLVGGAAEAAEQTSGSHGTTQLALLVSCIGRKLLMGQRVHEEIEAVRGVLGPAAHLTGFYSYGEISPHARSGICELHNQTMTITVVSEV